jgi:hypothetical protein
MPKEIIITVDLDTGGAELKADGFAGPACEKATKKYLEALGQTSGGGKTPDYFRTTTTACSSKQKLSGN